MKRMKTDRLQCIEGERETEREGEMRGMEERKIEKGKPA